MATGYGINLSERRLRVAAIDWIEDEGCDHAITLAINRPMPIEIATKRVSEWLRRLEQYIRGCRVYRLPPSARLTAFIVPEHLSSNIHFHIAVRLLDGRDVTPTNLTDVLEQAEKLWLSVQASGSFEAQRIYDGRGWGRYMTKDCWKDSELVLASDFHPN